MIRKPHVLQNVIKHIPPVPHWASMCTGCPQQNETHIFLFSPSVLMQQFYALHGQCKDVLTLILHIGTGLSDKRSLRYSGSGFDYQILWFTIDSSYI